jgi:hypothetical protein
MKSLLPKIAMWVIATLMTVYLMDYAWLRVRVSRGSGFDTVQVEVVDEIPQKGNKAEYVPEGPQAETCVRSLFPHMEDTPCWYLRRHALRQVNF